MTRAKAWDKIQQRFGRTTRRMHAPDHWVRKFSAYVAASLDNGIERITSAMPKRMGTSTRRTAVGQGLIAPLALPEKVADENLPAYRHEVHHRTQ